jgi:hypothetical protein
MPNSIKCTPLVPVMSQLHDGQSSPWLCDEWLPNRNKMSYSRMARQVRTLQLEMEYIYGCLEDEALEITEDATGSRVAPGRHAAHALLAVHRPVAAPGWSAWWNPGFRV